MANETFFPRTEAFGKIRQTQLDSAEFCASFIFSLNVPQGKTSLGLPFGET